MAALLDYVLRLQRDLNEYQTFKTSEEVARDQMTAAGLSAEQQDVLLSGSADKLQNALLQEITGGHAVGFVNGMMFTLSFTFHIPKPSTGTQTQ